MPASLDNLTTAELAALRLSAQVMAHKAELANSQVARLFFESLEAAAMAEEAGRSQSTPRRADHSEDANVTGLLRLSANHADRSVVSEYLGVLAANDRLPSAVRLVFRRLELVIGVPHEAHS